ncbi:MAG: OmpA family protein [Paludibacteraceae bacterium]|nr:OmpA family protein [Paludibacteraceae bacterium]
MKKNIYILSLLICALPLTAQQTSPEQVQTETVYSNEPLHYDTGNFLHFGFGGGLGQLGYNLQGGKTTAYMPSFTADIQYTYYFLPWLGLGTGVHLSYYTSQSNLTKQMIWEGQTDTEGDNYTHRVDFNNWRERQHDIMLEIPLAISFKAKPGKGGFYFNVGAKAGIPVYASYVHNRGDLIHSGYYQQWDVVLEQLPDRFETEPLLRAEEGSMYKKVNKINAAIFGELGGLIQLDPLTDLTLGIYADYYISNHSSVKAADATDLGFRNPEYHTEFMNPYEGLVGTKHIGAMHPWSVGVKIGIQAHLRTKAERAQAKARKQAEELDKLSADKDTLLLHDTVFVYDTIYVRDTLYMTVHDTIVGSSLLKDTTWIVRIDTICPDPHNPGLYINLTEERLRKEDEQMEQDKTGNTTSDNRGNTTGNSQQNITITEQGRKAAKKLDGKLTTSVIWFHFDDYKPILEPFDVIDTVAKALLSDPEMHVNINGHACKIGTDSYNQRLAMKRARAVARLLRLKGVPAKQLTVRSLGANEPYRYNEGRHQYSKDRRVEIVPIGADEQNMIASHSTMNLEQSDVNTAPQKSRIDINYDKYDKFIGEEKVKPGSRLAQIARRWYGHQEYWVFIYEANADKIENPSLIHPGLVVMIPDIKSVADGKSEKETLLHARELEKRYNRK